MHRYPYQCIEQRYTGNKNQFIATFLLQKIHCYEVLNIFRKLLENRQCSLLNFSVSKG